MANGQGLTGGCLCGGVRYRAGGKLRGVVACHCTQCARTTGHHYTATNCATKDFALDKDETLRWYRSSPEAERGFCSRCGGNLFWRRVDGDEISITAGTLDHPTGLRIRVPHLLRLEIGLLRDHRRPAAISAMAARRCVSGLVMTDAISPLPLQGER